MDDEGSIDMRSVQPASPDEQQSDKHDIKGAFDDSIDPPSKIDGRCSHSACISYRRRAWLACD